MILLFRVLPARAAGWIAGPISHALLNNEREANGKSNLLQYPRKHQAEIGQSPRVTIHSVLRHNCMHSQP